MQKKILQMILICLLVLNFSNVSAESDSEHWIADKNTGIYLWNPKPSGDEKISWSGSFIELDGVKYAQGAGTVIWYKDDKIVQVDEGNFEKGKHHGKFKHTFPSGNVTTSEWIHGVEQKPEPIPLGNHWIADPNTKVYLWNPEPMGDETISWSGSFVLEGEYRYAEGFGTIIWYRDGKVIQVDEGTFEHGRHHGRFKHTFPSGNVVYSNWNHGVEIPDEE